MSSSSSSNSNSNNNVVDDNMIRDTKRRKDNDGSATATATTEFDMQSDVDDVISDLVKEEMQLVMTRLLRTSPDVETSLKKEALRVINARARHSAAPQSKQLQMMQKLLQQHSTMAMAMSSAQAGGDLMDATQPLGLMTQGVDGLPLFAGGVSTGGPNDFVAAFMGDPVAMIRRKIREAFRPDNKSVSRKRDRLGGDVKVTYRIDTLIVRTELEHAKDMILNKNEQRQGLLHMEAITQEFSDRGAEIGVNNITGYAETLQQIAADWEEIFLFEELDMDAVERDEWDKKLGEMDISPNEEEGVFTVARYAARLGWSNQHLKNVLMGESIGKFKEPRELSIARLNHLERQKRYEEGVNLAKAVDLDFYAAKFLLRLNRLSEVEDTVKTLEDAEKIFSLAQVARALDVTVSFNLALQSIAVTRTWNGDNAERATWICDLCISQKMLDTLVAQLEGKINHKKIQFEIAKILKEKEQYKPALEICRYTIKPVKTDTDQIQSQQDALKKQHEKMIDSQSQQAVGSSSSSPSVSSPSVHELQQQQIDDIIQIDEGTIIPGALTVWMWALVHEMVLLELVNEDEMRAVVDYIVDTVTGIDQLVRLMTDMNSKNEFDLLIVVGNRAFDRIKEQQQREYQLQLELIKNQLEAQYAAQDAQHSFSSDPQSAQITLSNILNNLNQTINFQDNAIEDEVAFRELLKLVRERKATDIIILDRNTLVQQQQQLQRTLHRPSLIVHELSVGNNPFGSNGRKLISISHSGQWDQWRYRIAVLMTDAAFESNNPMLQNPQVVQQQQASRIGFALAQTLQQQQKQFRLPKPLARSKIEQVVNHCLEELSIVSHFTQYQKHLKEKSEYELTVRVGFRVHDIAKQLAEQKQKRDEEMLQLNQLRMEEQEAVQNKRTFKIDKRLRLRELEHQQKIYSLDDSSTKMQPRQYDDIHLEVGSLTLNSLFSARVSPDPSKQVTKEFVQEVAERTITFLRQQQQYETLANICLNHHEFDLCIFIARAGHRIVSGLKEKKLEREKVNVPLQILREEQEKLLSVKQQLPPQKQHELAQLERQSEALPPIEFFDGNSVDIYENHHTNFSRFMIKASMQATQIVTLPTTGFTNILAMQQQQQQQIREPYSEQEAHEIVLEAFSHVKAPSSYLELLNLVASYNQSIKPVIELGDRIQEEISKLVEERKAQEMPRLRYVYLAAQKTQLEAAKKFLRPEQLQELSVMEREQRLLRTMQPNYLRYALGMLGDNPAKQVANKCIELILQDKLTTQEELKELIEERLRHVEDDDQMTDDADNEELALARKENEERQSELEDRVKFLDQLLATTVQNHLQYVADPNERLRMSKTLVQYKEFDLAILVGKSIQAKIIEVAQERVENEVWLNELAELEKEERELQEQRKQVAKRRRLDNEKQHRLEELKIQRDFRSIFPSYLSSTEEQLNALHLYNSEAMINAVATKKETERARLELELEMTEEQKKQILAPYDTQIHEIVDICLEYVQAPEHLIRLMDQNSYDISLMLRLGKVALEKTKYCLERRQEINTIEQMINILEKEEQDLVLLRKTLPDELQKVLDDSNKKMDESTLPSYITNNSISDMHGWKYTTLEKMLNVVLRTKSQFENRMATDQSLTAEQIEQENAKISELLEQIVTLIKDPQLGIESPNNLHSLAQKLNSKSENKLAITVGYWCYDKLKLLRQMEEERQLPEQQFVLLSQEERSLLNQRKQLPEDKQSELRDLKLKHALLQLQPGFVRQTQAAYDRIAYQISSNNIESVLDLRQVMEDKMDMSDSQIDEVAVEQETHAIQTQLEQVVDLTIENIFVVENLIRVMSDLAEKLEYNLVLRVGGNVVVRIGELRTQAEEIKALEQEKDELQKKFRLQRDDATQQRLNEIEARLQQLPLKYQNTKLIDMLMLKTANLMNQAAKIEERNDVQLEMATAIFKIKPSVVLFGEIQLLCEESVWQTTLRKELLDHVLNYLKYLFENKDSPDVDVDIADDLYYSDDDDDDDGYRTKKKKSTGGRGRGKTAATSSSSASNPIKDCIELLLNEGYWQEVTKIFPRPSEAGTSSVELLERLWVELNNNAPAQIPGIVPLAEEYITHCFLLYEFDIVTDLLDLLENHDIEVAAAIYEKCAERMGLNISQRQYKSFASVFLPLVKNRLLNHNRSDLWDTFFEKVHKANKSKRKLMQMIETENLK